MRRPIQMYDNDSDNKTGIRKMARKDKHVSERLLLQTKWSGE